MSEPTTAHAFDDELARLDATATAAAVRVGEVTALEVVRAAIERARRLDAELSAIAEPDYERALERAAGPLTGAFAGVPTFIKDNVDVEGLPTREGSDAFHRVGPATRTAEIARQFADMGTVCLGKSSLPEFGFTASTEFPDQRATRNPWNLGHSAGGSSGGSAALVAAGVVPIAHGNDGGGSIRIPAAACGLVGLKGTRGRIVPNDGSKLLPVDIVSDGVLSRSVRDTATFFAQAETMHRDPRLPAVGHVTEPLDRPLRIGLVTEPPTDIEVDSPTRAALYRVAADLEALGHSVRPVELPLSARFAEDFTHYWAMLAYSVSRHGHRLYDRSFDHGRLTDLTHGLARHFRSRAHRTPGVVWRMKRSAADHAGLFTDIDVMLSPTCATLTPAIGHLGTHLPFDVLFPRVEQWVGFTPLANATGAPSISLPLGHDAASNLPIGIMFGAAHGQDRLLLELALQLEEAHPWPRVDQVPIPAAD